MSVDEYESAKLLNERSMAVNDVACLWLCTTVISPYFVLNFLLPAEGTSKSSSSLPFHELEKQVKDGLFTYPTRFTHFRRIYL
jgi:hypothetical protein